jgi:hypothetical protein
MIQWIMGICLGLPSFLGRKRVRKSQWQQIFLEQMKEREQGKPITNVKFVHINFTCSKATMTPGNLLWEWHM